MRTKPLWLSLTQALIKNSVSFSWQKNKKWWLIYALVILAFLPLVGGLLWLIFQVITAAYQVFATIGQTELLLQIIMTFLITFALIFSLTLVLNSFYFARDIEFLQTLPLKPSTILTAKTMVLLIFESFLNILVVGTALIAFGLAQGLTGAYILGAVIGTMTFSLTPVLSAAILIMILMSLTRFLRNKELVSKYSGLVSVTLVLVMTFAFSALGAISENQIEGFFLGENKAGLLRLSTWLFPNWHFLIQGMVHEQWAPIILYVGLCVVMTGLFYVIIDKFYLQGVLNLSEADARRQKINLDQMVKKSPQKVPSWSYWLKEMKILWRTPAYFNNCILINFIWPLLLWIILRGTNIQLIFDYFEWSQEASLATILAVNFALAFFIAGSNSIAVTALSREGSGYFFMKYIPVNYRIQLKAKMWSGISVGTVAGIVYLILVYPLLKLEGWYWLVMGVMLILINILVSAIGIMIDSHQPQLMSSDEQNVVRQNLNIYLTLIIAVVIASSLIGGGAILFLGIKLPLPIILGLITSILIVLSGIMYIIALKTASRNLAQIEN